MPTTPWRSQAPVTDDRDYLALISFLPLERLGGLPRFLRYSLGIQRQLRQSRGLAGYSLRAELLARRFWTLSAWEDEAALQQFVSALPHAASMTGLAPYMGATRFVRWPVKGADLPPSWEEALRRLDPGQ